MTRGVEESPGKRTESFLSWCLHSSNIFSGRVMASSPTYSLCFYTSQFVRMEEEVVRDGGDVQHVAQVREDGGV